MLSGKDISKMKVQYQCNTANSAI